MKTWLIRIGAGIATLAVLGFAVGYLARPGARATFGASAARVSAGAEYAPVPNGGAGGGVTLDAEMAQSMPGASEPVFKSAPTSSGSSTGDRIARTADITLEVKKGHFNETWVAAFRIASGFGGQVMTANRGENGGQPIQYSKRDGANKSPAFGDITMRIPSARFETATNELRAIGTVRGDATSAEDVSQDYVDLQSRLRNMRAEEHVLLALFTRAKTAGETIAIETKLADVQGQIEQATGQIKYIDSRTSFSFVTLHLSEPGAVFAPSNGDPTFAQAWDTALRGLVRIGSGVMIGAIWLAPFAALVFGGLALRRRRVVHTPA